LVVWELKLKLAFSVLFDFGILLPKYPIFG